MTRSNTLFLVFGLVCSVCPVFSLYSSSDDVVELTESNFKSNVINSNAVWIVEFYSPGCGHCVNFAPAYKEAARVLKGVVKVGGVDVTKHGSLAQKYEIRGFPTVKIFSTDKSNPSEYQGQRTAAAVANEALSHTERLVKKRLGGDSSSSSGSKGDGGVVELTASNFEEKVMKSNEPWMVGFFAPWCGHCQRLKPEYEAAARRVSGKVNVGAVDATVHEALAQKYNIRGFPTLYFFGNDKRNPELYEQGRTADDLVRFLTDKALASLPPPEAKELLSQSQLDVCKEKQLCIVAALPDILDCQSKCRKDYIKMIENAGEKYKTNDWLYFWVAAASQPELEKALNLGGFGYPAVVAMNVKKQKYAPMRGSFSADGIHEFLRDVSLGSRSISLSSMDKIPTVKKAEPWDGKDGEMPVEEEIDLSSLKMEL